MGISVIFPFEILDLALEVTSILCRVCFSKTMYVECWYRCFEHHMGIILLLSLRFGPCFLGLCVWNLRRLAKNSGFAKILGFWELAKKENCKATCVDCIE